MNYDKFIEVFHKLPDNEKEEIIKLTEERLKMLENDEAKELISEAGGVTAYRDGNIFIAIQPDQGRNFEKDAYFKISWQNNFRDNDKVARISMKSPARYIYHATDGTRIDSKIKLNNILRMQSTNTKYGNITVWECLLHAISEICNVDYNYIKNEYKTIPDYSIIIEDLRRNPTKWRKG